MSDQDQGQQQEQQGVIDTSDAPAPTPPASYNPNSDNSGAPPVMGNNGGVQDDSTGVDEQVAAQNPQQQPQQWPGGSQPSGPLAPVAQFIRRMIAGEGADPKILQEYGGADQKIDQMANNGLQDTPAQRPRPEDVIHQAVQQGGPEAGAGPLQAFRVIYNTQNAFASQAMKGANGKPPDLNAAINAANKAQEALPDGSSVIFSPNGNRGVIAVAQMPGTNKTVQFNLTPQQFAQFINPGGKDSHFDKMIDTSAPAQLQRLVQATTEGGDPSNANAQAPRANVGKRLVAPQPGDDDDEGGNTNGKVPDRSTVAPQKANGVSDEQNLRDGTGYQPRRYAAPHARSLDAFPGRDLEFAGNTKHDDAIDRENARHGLRAGDQPPIPGTHDKNGNYIGPNKDKPLHSPDYEARSTAIVGKGNIGAEGKRQQMMNDWEQQDAALQNKKDVATIQGTLRVQQEGVRQDAANSRQNSKNSTAIQIAANRVAMEIQRQADISKRNDDREAAQNFNHIMQNMNILKPQDILDAARLAGVNLSPAQISKMVAQAGGGLPQGQPAPAPAAHGQAQPGQGNNNVPPLKERVAGKTRVTTSKGSFVWNGHGWDAE